MSAGEDTISHFFMEFADLHSYVAAGVQHVDLLELMLILTKLGLESL